MPDRRAFLRRLGGVAAGALALPYVPEKLYFIGGFPSALPPDPLSQVAVAGWKVSFTEKITEPSLATLLEWRDKGIVSNATVVQATLQQYGAYQTLSDLTEFQREFYNRRILERILPQLPLDLVRAVDEDLKAQTVAWRKWQSLEGRLDEPMQRPVSTRRHAAQDAFPQWSGDRLVGLEVRKP